MALTDVFISPSGAGDNSGSSVANALPAVSSGDWSTNIENLTRQDRRFIFLEGTYNVSSELVFTSSDPTIASPNIWVGAKSDGTLLEPQFDETGMHLVTDNYPKIINSANTNLIDTAAVEVFKCIYFENTTSRNGPLINSTFNEAKHVAFIGCYGELIPNGINAMVFVNFGGSMIMCEAVMNGTNYRRIVQAGGTNQSAVINCRVYGGGKSGTNEGRGIEMGTQNDSVVETLIYNVHGPAIYDGTSNDRNSNMINCTVISAGGDGHDTSGTTDDQRGTSIHGNIFFDVDGDGIKANSTFSESDTPSSPPSVVSFIPSPIMDLKWSFDTGLRNFFNEIFGQPRQFTSSPTDQPIGKMVAPPIVPGLTQSGLAEHQQAIIDTYNNN